MKVEPQHLKIITKKEENILETISLREDVYEECNFDIIGYAPTKEGQLRILYAPNWEVQGPRYFMVATADKDGYTTDESKFCRILADRPEYLMGVDGKDSKLTKEEKESLIDFFKNGGDVRWSGYPNISGWEGYIMHYNNDKGAGCFAEIPEDEKDIEDTIETLPMPDYSLLETED